MSLFRRTTIWRGPATSNLFAPPFSGRWFNPPHQWAWTDMTIPFLTLFGGPMWIALDFYYMAYVPHYSHYQQKNYYPTQPYTKEFIQKYKRLERWRFY